MNRDEFDKKSEAMYNYFVPGKCVSLSGVQMTMVSLNNCDFDLCWADNDINEKYLPYILFSYKNNIGDLKMVKIYYNDIKSLNAINGTSMESI